MENIEYTQYKKRLLNISLAIDGLGLLSYLMPGIGEWTDILLAFFLAYTFYKNYYSIGWTALLFAEEIAPFTDIIPSAFLAWLFRFVFFEEETKARFKN